jgi:hypothetical protein
MPVPRRSVTRREYAELAVRLGAVEMQMQRNRTTVEAQALRIAQLQEQVNALQASTVTQAFGTDLPALPSVPTPTVES